MALILDENESTFKRRPQVQPVDRNVVGWREWASLPDFGIKLIKTKIDSGAKTSVLHTFKTEVFKLGKKDCLRFWVHPLQRNISKEVICVADIIDYRLVTDSGGHKEYRYIVKTHLGLGDRLYPIELSLTNRDSLKFRMLLGREGIKNKFLIDVTKSYLLGKPMHRPSSKKSKNYIV